MAITNIKRQQDVAQEAGKVQSQTPYQGLQGVSANTQANLGNYQQGYKPSQTVTDAQNALNGVQAAKPATYANKYSADLDNILQQIQNPQEFRYNFADDEMFRYYADMYQENGKQAAMDVQGQAAGLTGGYGNSYGATVGNQQYQQYLRQIYDKGMDMRDRAYQVYSDQQANQYNQLGALQGMDQQDFQKYQADLAAWQADRDYAAQQEAQAYERDYGQYGDQLGYWTGMAQAENADWQNQRSFDESVREFGLNFDEGVREFNATNDRDWASLQEQQRQFDANLTEEQRQYNQNYAIELASAILANGKMPSNEMLVAAGLSYEDAQKLMAEIKTGGSGGPGSGKDDKGKGNGNNVQHMLLTDYQDYLEAKQNALSDALTPKETQVNPVDLAPMLNKSAIQEKANNLTAEQKKYLDQMKLKYGG